MPGERRALERRAVDALADRTDLEARVLRVELLSRTAPDQNGFELATSVALEAAEQAARRTVARAVTVAARMQQDAQLDPAPLARLRRALRQYD